MAGQRRGRGPTRVGGRRLPRLPVPDCAVPDCVSRLRRATARQRRERTPHGGVTQRHDVVGGLYQLVQARVLRPSYAWLLGARPPGRALTRFLQVNDTGRRWRGCARCPRYRHALARQQVDAEHCLARVMIRTGGRLSELRGAELLHYADVVRTSGRHRREHLAWEPLVALGVFVGEPPTLRAAWSAKGNTRQHSVATLVDRYGIPHGFGTCSWTTSTSSNPPWTTPRWLAWPTGWCGCSGGRSCDINPAQADLRLSTQTITAWRERLALTTDGQTRREIHSILIAVRAFYRDLAEWAHDDPARWGIWVAPCPVPRTADPGRVDGETTATSHHAGPHPSPHPTAAGLRRRRRGPPRLAASGCWPPRNAGRRSSSSSTVSGSPAAGHQPLRLPAPSQPWAEVLDSDPGARPVPPEHGRVNITRLEDDGFWAWAIIETLRHTGIRIEELLELTQLSLRHYTPPSQHAGAAAAHRPVQDRHRTPGADEPRAGDRAAGGATPRQGRAAVTGSGAGGAGRCRCRCATTRTRRPTANRCRTCSPAGRHPPGSPLRGATSGPCSTRSRDWAGLTDAGEPVRFTPHDFRRLFTTELVGAGLPLHIAASLLGHLSLDTTRGYTAVFPEHVIAAHERFIERRRRLRPDAELRPATGEEWAEFEQHFLLRKVALGDCHRPYGTPCVHEHACTRCRFLRVDPAQLGRLEEMTTNAEARLVEARDKVWLGEVAALEESLTHLRRRRAEAHTQLTHGADTTTDTDTDTTTDTVAAGGQQQGH